MFLPSFSERFASSMAAQTAAPEDMPTSTPSVLPMSSADRECVLVGDGDYLVIHLGIQHVRHEARADALYLVRSGDAGGQHRGSRRLHRDDLHAGHFLLEVLADAGDRAAGADAGHEVINRAVGIGDRSQGRWSE